MKKQKNNIKQVLHDMLEQLQCPKQDTKELEQRIIKIIESLQHIN